MIGGRGGRIGEWLSRADMAQQDGKATAEMWAAAGREDKCHDMQVRNRAFLLLFSLLGFFL